MNKKILNKTLKDNRLDAIISINDFTRLWYAKVKTTYGILAIEKERADLLVDGRYLEHCKENAKNVKIHLLTAKSLKEFFKDKAKQYKRIGLEEEYITLEQKAMLKKAFPKAKFISISGQKLRIIKSDDEILLLKKASKLSLQALDKVKHMLKPGVREIDIDHQLNLVMKQMGAKKESFDSIVVSGKRGSLPHGNPSTKKLKAGELVTVDFGLEWKGYVSDVTRTFRVGTVKNKKLLEIEEILRKAQKMGIAAIKPGVSTFEIDKICRDYIDSKGYGKYFVHSTGHGVGVEVHELPNVSSNKKVSEILKAGMVITVEPGIYIEDFGGIRVEDDILVTKTGHLVLSK